MVLSVFLRYFLAAVAIFFSCICAAESSFDQDYNLGAGDKITIRVFDESDLSMDVLIADSGVLNYPFLGDIKVLDITIAELERRIDQGLRGDYLVDPSVHIAITEYRPFFIQGEVSSPGAYPFQPGLNIGKAIAVARGFTERAAKKKIFIVRANDPYQVKHLANTNDPVQPGDMIVVNQSFF